NREPLRRISLMYGLFHTTHFQIRTKQRGLSRIVIDALVRYGESRLCHRGVDSLIFTKRALDEIRSDCGPHVFRMCEKKRNAYIIMSEDGVLITVARSYRNTVH